MAQFDVYLPDALDPEDPKVRLAVLTGLAEHTDSPEFKTYRYPFYSKEGLVFVLAVDSASRYPEIERKLEESVAKQLNLALNVHFRSLASTMGEGDS